MARCKVFQGILLIISTYCVVRLFSLYNFSGIESTEVTKEKQYILSFPDSTIKTVPFDQSLLKIFPEPALKPGIEKKTASKSAVTVKIPDLEYIGVIETGKKVYSFRNLDTGNLILLEEGNSAEGVTLISVKSEACSLEINGHIIRVAK